MRGKLSNIKTAMDWLLLSHRLFGGNDKMFKELMAGCKVYGEYGCGKSTTWVLNHFAMPVYAVDTNPQWGEVIMKKNNHTKRLHLNAIDVGAVDRWGRPLSYAKRENFLQYQQWLWQQPEVPDLVLIDGRFRVACFLTTLQRAPAGTQIIFDDYIKRKYYHIIEEFVTPKQVCGRQCLFIVPNKQSINQTKLTQMIEQFQYVLD